ncbi:MAG: alpha/beta hydrolase [Rhodoferax sp.]|nr:alpha/beta hydrolase [Rhodoferax sp.]
MRKYSYLMPFVAMFMVGCQSIGSVSSETVSVKQLRVNETILAYVEQGNGAPVVFVHGASLDWRAWDGLRGDIAASHRFVSMSRRYHHPNTWTDEGQNYTFDQQIEDVAGFIKRLNVGKVHLVGNSYSGRLVGFLAVKYPEILRSVVLGEPSLAAPSTAEGKAATAAYAKELAQASAVAKAGDNKQAAILVANAVLGDPDGFKKMSPIRQQRWLDNAITMAPMFAGRPSAPVSCEQLKNLKVPVMVVRGERTRDSFVFGHDALLGCLPPSTVAAVIPGATHMWPADNPSGAAAAILSFVAKN